MNPIDSWEIQGGLLATVSQDGLVEHVVLANVCGVQLSNSFVTIGTLDGRTNMLNVPGESRTALYDELVIALGKIAEQAMYPQRFAEVEHLDMPTWDRFAKLVDNRLLQLTRQHAQLEQRHQDMLERHIALVEIVKNLEERQRDTAGRQQSELRRLVDDYGMPIRELQRSMAVVSEQLAAVVEATQQTANNTA